MAIIQPFDLEKIFLVTLAGTPEIFAFICIIGMSIASAYFKLNNTIFLIMIGLFGIIMAGNFGGIYLLTLIFMGLVTFHAISKIIK